MENRSRILAAITALLLAPAHVQAQQPLDTFAYQYRLNPSLDLDLSNFLPVGAVTIGELEELARAAGTYDAFLEKHSLVVLPIC